MNPIYRNSSNKELARFCEQWADDADVNKKKSVSLSPEMLRLIAERLNMPTDEDIESELADLERRIKTDAKNRLQAVVNRINYITDELQSAAQFLEVESDHITDPLPDDEKVND